MVWFESKPMHSKASPAWGLRSGCTPPRGMAAKSAGAPVLHARTRVASAAGSGCPRRSCGSALLKLAQPSG